MKYSYLRILICALSLLTLSKTNAQQQNENSVLISENPTSFLNEFSKINKTGKGSSSVRIQFSSSKSFELNLNVRNQQNQTTSYIGSVNNKDNISFSIIYDNGQLEGHIIERTENKAYRLFTDKANRVKIKETDINSILCIAFDKEKSTNSASQNNIFLYLK